MSKIEKLEGKSKANEKCFPDLVCHPQTCGPTIDPPDKQKDYLIESIDENSVVVSKLGDLPINLLPSSIEEGKWLRLVKTAESTLIVVLSSPK